MTTGPFGTHTLNSCAVSKDTSLRNCDLNIDLCNNVPCRKYKILQRKARIIFPMYDIYGNALT